MTGQIDLASSEALRKQLDDALTAGARRLDMTAVDFMDSTGIRELLIASARLDGEGPIRILASRQVARVFEITGLDHIPAMELQKPD